MKSRTLVTANERRAEAILSDLVDRLNTQVSPFSKKSPPLRHRFQLFPDVEKWGRIYMPHYFESISAEFHNDLDEIIQWPKQSIFAIHGPREHAKSSRLRVGLTMHFLHGSLPFYLFGSETKKLAWFHIDFIYSELIENPRIKSDYNVSILKKDETNGVLRFSVEHKLTHKRTFTALQAVSYETGAKGLTYKQLRPSGAFIDDFEDTKSSRNESIGKAKEQWIRQEVYPAVKGSVIWVGNMSNKSSALYHAFKKVYKENLDEYLKTGESFGKLKSNKADLIRKKTQYFALSYRADTLMPDSSIRYLWPQRYPHEWYNDKKSVMGSTYAGEMNGRPEKSGSFFKDEAISTWTKLPPAENSYWFSWFDPAWGRTKKACYKALFAGCYDGRFYYIVDCFFQQGKSMASCINAWSEMFDRWPQLRSGGYENAFDQAQRFQGDLELIELKGLGHLPVQSLENPGNKFVRIESLEMDWNQGRILWPQQRTKDMEDAIDQICNYPDDEFVDAPDSLEALRTQLRTRFRRLQTKIETEGERRFNFNNQRAYR